MFMLEYEEQIEGSLAYAKCKAQSILFSNLVERHLPPSAPAPNIGMAQYILPLCIRGCIVFKARVITDEAAAKAARDDARWFLWKIVVLV